MTEDVLDIEGDFAAGRKDGLAKVDGILRFDTQRNAHIAVQDFFGFGMNKEQTEALSEMAVIPFLDYFRELAMSAAKGLRQGHSVYDLTGQEEIRTYKAITSGDYDAGFKSAALDSEYLLFSMDTEKVIADFIEKVSLPDALRDVLVKKDQERDIRADINGNTKKRTPNTVIRDFLNSIIAVRMDMVLSKIEGDLVQKAKTPKFVGYVGAEAEPVKYVFLRAAYDQLREPMNKIARTHGKVKSVWPPFKVNVSTYEPEQAERIHVTIEEMNAQEDVLPENKNEKFAAGFEQTLEEFYIGSQKLHFQTLQKPQGGYSKLLGVSEYWNKIAKNVAVSSFSDLRQLVYERMQAPAKGEGDSYDDGRNAAIDWISSRIDVLDLKGALSREDTAKRILDKFKNYWKETSRTLLDPSMNLGAA